jgi:hypothetical protein
MTSIESAAAFANRARTIGISVDVLDALTAGGVATFGSFAFCCPYVPGQPDEEPFKAAVHQLLGRDATMGESAGLRRLYYESHALALADMKSKIDRTENDEPKSLPAPEREVRLRDQKTRLAGVVITPSTQPSNSLVDRCFQQLDDQIIKYIPLHKCASREAELSSTDKERSLVFDNSGHLKVQVKVKDIHTSVSTDMQVREAMVRRALAYDQAGLIGFNTLNHWIQRLFECMSRTPPPGYASISLDQILAADREIFKLVSDATSAAVTPLPGGVRPVDPVFERFSTSPEVMFFILPLPSKSGSTNTSRSDEGNWVRTNTFDKKPKGDKGGGKGKKSNKGNGKSQNSLPDGCVPKWNGKPICYSFNRGYCTRVKPGKRCQYGFHVCFKKDCHRLTPHTECSHSA